MSDITISQPTAQQWAQKRLAELRFLGYIGAQFNALLVPLLVLHLTHSVTLAGVVAMIEWAPKLLVYLIGGSFVQRFSSARLHIALDIVRLLAMIALGVCSLGYGSFWVIAVASAFYQCANALANVLFEVSVTRWWDAALRAAGHARMFLQMQMGCLVAVLAGFALGGAPLLCALAIAIQGWTLLRTHASVQKLYPSAIHDPIGHPAKNPPAHIMPAPPFALRLQITNDLGFLRHGELLQFALRSLLLAMPSALVFSVLVFLVERVNAPSTEQTSLFSFVLLARTLTSILALKILTNQLCRKPGLERVLAPVGICALIAGAAAVILAPSLPWLVGAVVSLGLAELLYLPWLRAQRQELLIRTVPTQSRSGVTGILIATEASAYLVAAFIMYFMGSNLTHAITLAGLMGMTGAWLTLRRAAFAAPVRTGSA